MLGLLTNLRAQRNRAGLDRVVDELGDLRGMAHVATATPEAMPRALTQLADMGTRIVVVNGGDGTLSTTLQALRQRELQGFHPDLALLRGGRTNLAARDLGARRSRRRDLASLRAASRKSRFAPRVIDRPVLRVSWYEEGAFYERFGTFLGAGWIHEGTQLVRRRLPKRYQGTLGSSLVAAGLIARTLLPGGRWPFEPPQLHAVIDGQPIDLGPSQLLMITSLERILLGMRPFWGTGQGGLRMTSLRADAPGLWRALPNALRGRPPCGLGEPEGYVSRRATAIHLRMDAGFTIDGEFVPPAPGRALRIEADTRLRFVAA